MLKITSLVLLLATNTLAQTDILEHMGLSSGNSSKASNKTASSPDTPCSTPKKAIRRFLFDEGRERILCFENSDRTTEELIGLAQKMSAVMRANGVTVRLNSVPEDKDYQEANSNRYVYYLSNQFKQIYVRKIDGQWLFPNEIFFNVEKSFEQTQKISFLQLYNLMPSWATDNLWGIDGFSIAQILLLLLLVMAGLIIKTIVTYFVAKQVGQAFSRFEFHHFEQLIKNASMPLGNLAMAAIMAMILPGLDLNVHITHYIFIAIRIFAGVSAVILAYRSVDVLSLIMMQRALKTKSKLDDQLMPLFRKGLKIITLIVGAIFVLQNLDVDVTSLLAGVTIGGLAFSFAARDTVANLFGSITIFADKPFVSGDWIKAAGVEGIVESVGFRSTRIRTFYNSLVSIPNSKFTDSVVDNLGERKYRRILSELGLAYDTDPKQIEAFCNGIRSIIKAHPSTRKDYFEIHFSGYGDFSLKIMLYFFAHVATWSEELRVRHEVYLDILRLAKKMNISFAFPTQTLHIETMAQAKEIIKPAIPSEDDLVGAAKYFSVDGEGRRLPGPRVGKMYLANED